jgi:hypothetical protein
MNASGDNELLNRGGDSLMHGGNVEFSDIEIEERLVIEPVRTRSQSRAKEPSQPPSDIEKVEKKKGRPRKTAAVPKRRRRIVEESDDDEDD